MKSLTIFSFFALLFFLNCTSSEDDYKITNPIENDFFIKGADLSFLPELRESGLPLRNKNGAIEDPLLTLKNSGVNTVRLRLWKDPQTKNSNFETVKKLSQEIQNNGMKVFLSVHYSDTWADPSQQVKPQLWEALSFSQLKDSVYTYTQKIISEIKPEYVQIGNEINNGLLFPDGNISDHNKMKTLLNQGISATRDTNPNTKIILHYAGYQHSLNFFENLSDLDFDIIGISYYPMWHGKSLTTLQETLTNLSETFDKPVIIAETSYPFTLEYNDYTNNIVGETSQLLTEYPATETGQFNYLNRIKNLIIEVPNGIGFCYWGGEWVSYKGKSATNGSTYENQAFWDFNNNALSIINCYK